MLLKVEPNGVSLAEIPNYTTFADLEWADLWYWELGDEHHIGGNWVWLIATFDTDKLPADVVGLAVREPIDRKRWEDLLRERLPFNPDEEE